MKSIILAGVARSGKTKTAERLHKATGISLIPGDLLMSTFEGIFPEIGIIQGQNYHEATSRKAFHFFRVYMSLHKDWQNYNFILDTTHLLPEQVVEHGLEKEYQIAFLGYPNISVEDKLAQIRAHHTKQADWTRDIDDEGMRPIIQQMIDLGRMLEGECAKYSLPFFDTSKDFKAVLEEAYQYCLQGNDQQIYSPSLRSPG